MGRITLRVYADTSVFGGVLDEEFGKASRAFLEQVREGRFELVVSALVEEEIAEAPEQVRAIFYELVRREDVLPVTAEALELREAYLSAGIVGPGRRTDALHVAMASVSECVLIASWNFRHIVHYDKIPQYNAVNIVRGHRSLGIFSPPEVIGYEEKDL